MYLRLDRKNPFLTVAGGAIDLRRTQYGRSHHQRGMSEWNGSLCHLC